MFWRYLALRWRIREHSINDRAHGCQGRDIIIDRGGHIAQLGYQGRHIGNGIQQTTDLPDNRRNLTHRIGGFSKIAGNAGFDNGLYVGIGRGKILTSGNG